MEILKLKCKHCEKEKYACEFSFSKQTKDGFQKSCKQCMSKLRSKHNKGPADTEFGWKNKKFGFSREFA